jgi:hypothetical protein
LSEHKRAFLREHPNLLEPANVNAVRFHYHAARNAGVTDDSPEMNRAILDGIAHDRLDRARVALPMDGRHNKLEPSSAEPSDAVGGRSGGLWSAGSKPRSGARRSRRADHRGPFIPPRAINSGRVLGFPIRSYAMVGSGAMVGTVRI